MTTQEFYEKLKKTKNTFVWKEGNTIRGNKSNNIFCPITAVAYQEKNFIYKTSDYRKAGKAIGLTTVRKKLLEAIK